MTKTDFDQGHPLEHETDLHTTTGGAAAGLLSAPPAASASSGSSGSSASDDDPFDPAKLRLSGQVGADLGQRKLVMTVPVRKPNRHEFVRVHGDAEFQFPTYVFALKEDRDELYLVAPHMRGELAAEVYPVLLRLALTRQGVLLLVPVRLPEPDGRHNSWHRSLYDACNLAVRTWVRIASNQALKAYEVFEAVNGHDEPQWPDLTLHQILKVAFQNRLIDSTDHPILKRLRGEVL